VRFFKEKKRKNTLYITAVGGSEIVELLVKMRKLLRIARQNGIVSRLDGVCRLLEPLLEIPDQLVLARNFL
jgi:hypothetical protein